MSRLVLRWALLGLAVLVVAALAVGVAFAGSAGKLAEGVTLAGVDVGGLTPEEAQRLLEQRARVLANVPVVFTSGTRKWPVQAKRVGIDQNWATAVESADDAGDGFLPLRGLQRFKLRLFGQDLTPPTTYWKPALAFYLQTFSRVLDQPHRDAALRLKGLRVVVVPGHGGHVLDRDEASELVVSALASLDRRPVPLPIRSDPQRVTSDDLDAAVQQAQIAVSAPVRLRLGPTRWRIAKWRIAKMLTLPHDGSRTLEIGGPGAAAFFRRLTKKINRPPLNADFAISASNRVRVVPAKDGRLVDVEETSERLLAAALSPTNRAARVAVVMKSPARSTEAARAMGITGLVAGYETIYGGDPNRIHNVQLVAQLIDDTLIAPGKTFSFNATTGERTPEKGFREAPVIINGELQNGIGGGVCQVSTTVFNAAYEAGLRITERSNHALYISHYPQGRDATVNYPDLDLKFVNDTGNWILLRTYVGSSSLTVALYGTPVNRRVESNESPLVETGEVPVTRIADADLYVGEEVVDQYGQPSRSTSVQRRVFGARDRLLYDDTWTSSYSSEPTVIRYGTKPRPVPEPPPPPVVEEETEETAPTETTPEIEPEPPPTTPKAQPGPITPRL